MVVFDITLYLLVGLTVMILIPWACLETASFFSGLRQRAFSRQDGHWFTK